jgi:hypothetical protein
MRCAAAEQQTTAQVAGRLDDVGLVSAFPLATFCQIFGSSASKPSGSGHRPLDHAKGGRTHSRAQHCIDRHNDCSRRFRRKVQMLVFDQFKQQKGAAKW